MQKGRFYLGMSAGILQESFVFGSGPPNERMQLTWLIGTPIRVGFGSPACRRATRLRLTRHAADASR